MPCVFLPDGMGIDSSVGMFSSAAAAGRGDSGGRGGFEPAMPGSGAGVEETSVPCRLSPPAFTELTT